MTEETRAGRPPERPLLVRDALEDVHAVLADPLGFSSRDGMTLARENAQVPVHLSPILSTDPPRRGTYADLEPALVGAVESLIDFITEVLSRPDPSHSSSVRGRSDGRSA
jgi:hypothetical protein